MRFKEIRINAPATFKEPIQIKHIIMMGDSLSDRGTLDNESLFWGLIRMAKMSGLEGRSPDGRFTNGRVWGDHISAEIASDFTIKRLQRRWHMSHSDVADAVIAKESKVLKAIRNEYSLDDDKYINYQGKTWIRSYCIGGLTAHDYSWTLSTSIVRFFTRLIVSTLEKMRKALLKYDEQHQVSYEQKEESLVIEWSGANDLVTVNAEPSIEEVDKAIRARIENMKQLIAKGYRNFMTVNLPDISLTPRYQNKSKEEQKLAQLCADYFNDELIKACNHLSQIYPHCTFDAFDINALFRRVYHHPEQYGMDKNKLRAPYISSKDFNAPKDGLSPATGYMFYDDLHPSADVHALLASYFYDRLSLKYELLEPNRPRTLKQEALSEEVLVTCFRHHYQEQLNIDKHQFFGLHRTNIKHEEADLECILRHALKEKGGRSLGVLIKLGWVNKEGALLLNVPALKNAFARANGIEPVVAEQRGPIASAVLKTSSCGLFRESRRELKWLDLAERPRTAYTHSI